MFSGIPSSANGQHIYCHRDGSTQDFVVQYNFTGFTTAVGANTSANTGPSVTGPSFAAVVLDGVSQTVYQYRSKNVVAFPYLPGASGITPSALNRQTGGRGVSVFVPVLVIFNRALSDSEIKSLSDNPWQVFAGDSKALWTPAAASVSLPTLVSPASTTSAGAWTATGAGSLHAAINELVPSDTQYISVNSASTTELVLAESAYPGAANQTLAYRASSTQGSTLTVTLKQGVTTIMTRTHALTGTDTLYTQTLTSGEIALITAGPISVTLTTS